MTMKRDIWERHRKITIFKYNNFYFYFFEYLIIVVSSASVSDTILYVCVPHICLVPKRPDENIRSPGHLDVCQSPCGSW